MVVKSIIDEDFVNYRKPSMYIATSKCDWKCGRDICQNSPTANMPDFDIEVDKIINRYLRNNITKAIVFCGLEPMLQIQDLLLFIKMFRDGGNTDDVVIYTGYYEHEIEEEIALLKQFKNIVVKFGRFIPNANPVFDTTLGVQLNSDNQYAVRIS